MIGLHLSQYRIDAELGRGGMGIVYRATDTKLNRTVALKVLPPAALASEEDRARFFREAQAAAQLSHPNVCHVYQVDEAIPTPDGSDAATGGEMRPFIAMEFIEGDTLAARITRAPLKLSEAVSIAAQVAEALRAAHAKQIVHRDIKSANVMLTSDGIAKVLDFGLAKTQASTMLTRQGSTLGTIAYMSPEQARGQEVDSRTDLYSLGTMLYEMVAGRLPFAGDYEQAVVYGILNEPPEPLTALRTGVPMQLEWVVNKLLSKEADYRYQTAADLLADLKSLDLTGSGHSRRSMAVSGSMAAGRPTATPSLASGAGFPRWAWGAVAGLVVLATAAGWWIGRGSGSPPDDPVRRMQMSFNPAANVFPRVSVSEDGRAIATFSREEDGTQLVVRFLEEDVARMLDRSSGAAVPALSPDARWVAFRQIGAMYRAPTSGGSAELVTDLDAAFASWLSNEELVLAGAGGMWTVTLDGKSTVVDLDLPSDVFAVQPAVIPGTRSILYVRYASGAAGSSVWALDLVTGTSREVVSRAVWPRYHPAGYVLFFRSGDLHAVPFDAETFESGASFVVATGLFSAGDGFLVAYDISQTDVLAYFAGSSLDSDGRQLIIQEPGGAPNDLGLELKDYWDPKFAPDGSRVLVHATAADGETDIWMVDPERRTVRRMTSDAGEDETPVWSPDGTSFYYAADGSGFERLVRRSVDGSGPVDTLLSQSHHLHVESVSADERYVVVMLRDGSSDNLWLVDTTKPGEMTPLLTSQSNEAAGKISPDGRQIAFQSDESGRDEVYLASFPSMTNITPISSDGGITPVWSRDGSSIYYMMDNDIMRVDVGPSGPGRPTRYLEGRPGTFRQSPHTTFDVMGGRVIYAYADITDVQSRDLKVVTGLGSLLRSLDPARDGR